MMETDKEWEKAKEYTREEMENGNPWPTILLLLLFGAPLFDDEKNSPCS